MLTQLVFFIICENILISITWGQSLSKNRFGFLFFRLCPCDLLYFFFWQNLLQAFFFRLSFVRILYIFIRTFFIKISIIYHKMIKRVSCKSEWTFFWMPIDYDLSLLEYFFHIFERRHRIGDNRLDCSWRPYQRPLLWQERYIRLSWPIHFPSRSQQRPSHTKHLTHPK